MFKIIKFNTPVNLRNKLTFSQDGRIQLVPGRLKISRDSFRWRTVCEWNVLPEYLISAVKVSIFKKLLRKHIIDGRLDIIARRPPERD